MFIRHWTLAVAALLMAATSSAATITAVSTFRLPGTSTGSLGPVGSTPAVNNDDDPAASPNVIPFSVFLNSPGVLETEFVLADSGGTTEYRFTQNFVNTISAPWNGFRFELGFGTGAGFVQTGDVRFDTLNGQPTATSSVFTLVSQIPTQLEWSLGTAPLVASFVFAIDVPDGMESFTLRQTPVESAAVPEPSTVSLFAVAGLALAFRRS